MIYRPDEIPLEPILCPHCLGEGRAQRTWRDPDSRTLICSIHGPIFELHEAEH